MSRSLKTDSASLIPFNYLPMFVMIALLSLAYLTAATAISIDTSVLKPALQPFIASYAFPGASFAVATRDTVVVDAIGHFAYNASLLPPFNNGQNPAVDPASTIYDIASLSKVVATTAAVALLHQENLLDLNLPIASPSLLGPAFAAHGKGSITSLHCLTHSAGFPADPSPNYWESAFGCADPSPPNQPRALSTACRGRIFASILDQTLAYPVNSGYIYSDLSFLVLAYVVGAVSRNHTLVPASALRPECAQMTLDADVLMCYFEAFVRVRVFDALGMRNTRFIPDASLYSRCAPAEDQRSGYARTVIQGTVSDGNAFAMGGIAGHAGVFSTAADVARLASAFMWPDRVGLLTTSTASYFVREFNHTQSSRALGWNTNDPFVDDFGTYASCGNLSALTFMHTGYTGTQICGDPVLGVITVLLTNRVFPTDATGSSAVQAARRAFNNAVLSAVQPSPTPAPSTGGTSPGMVVVIIILIALAIGGIFFGYRTWVQRQRTQAENEYHSMAATSLTSELS